MKRANPLLLGLLLAGLALFPAAVPNPYYIHLLVYVVINAGLFFLNLLTKGDDGGWWFYWPLAAWGIAVAIHTMVVFSGVFSEWWKQRKAEEIYRRSQHDS